MMDGWNDGMGPAGWIVMVVVWIGLLALLIWAATSLFAPTGRPAHGGSAQEILDRRLAAGEIDRAQCDELRAALGGGAAPVRPGPTRRPLLIGILVAALLILLGTIVWAVASADDDSPWSMHRYGAGMMGYAAASGSGEPVRDVAGARGQAERFASRLDLRVAEVMQFSNGYYAELEEADGEAATEVLVDPQTGAVWPEFGPAMMWNIRYGMMSDAGGEMRSGMMDGAGMMGRAPSTSVPVDPTWPHTSADSHVTAEQAMTIADRWLATSDSTLRAADVTAFPGYYTFHVLRDGAIAGMLSVNAATGSVWYHWWHGDFVTMTE